MPTKQVLLCAPAAAAWCCSLQRLQLAACACEFFVCRTAHGALSVELAGRRCFCCLQFLPQLCCQGLWAQAGRKCGAGNQTAQGREGTTSNARGRNLLCCKSVEVEVLDSWGALKPDPPADGGTVQVCALWCCVTVLQTQGPYLSFCSCSLLLLKLHLCKGKPLLRTCSTPGSFRGCGLGRRD